jgi:hypothetical protein
MEWVQIAVTVFGLIFLGWYQRYKIKILATQNEKLEKLLDDQHKILKNAQVYTELFNPEKLKEYVAIREEVIEKRNEVEFHKIKSEFESKIEKTREVALKIFSEFEASIKIAINLITYCPREMRAGELATVPESIIKEAFRDAMEKLPYYGDFQLKALLPTFLASGNLKEKT